MIQILSRGLGHTAWNHRTLAVIILFLQCCSMISPALSYRADISPARNSVQLPRGPAGVPGLVLSEKNPFSQHAFSRRKKLKQRERDESGAFHEVTSEQCTSMGLEKCGDMCVEQCCNAESALVCPVNSYCTANDEYEFCCEKGHTCSEPIGCLNQSDIRCVNNAGELIDDDGEEKACCYAGFEVCTTIWDGFPACIPTGIVEVPSKPQKHTHTGPFDSDVANPPLTASEIYSKATPTTTTHPHYKYEIREEKKNEKNASSGVEGTSRDTHPEFSGIGATIGGVVGGILGFAILGVCTFLTRKHYRRAPENYEQGGSENDAVVKEVFSIRGGEVPESRSLNSWLDLGVEDTERNLPSAGGVSSWSNPTLYGTASTERSRQSSCLGKTHADEWNRSREKERSLERSQSRGTRSYSTKDSFSTGPPYGSISNYTSPSTSPPPTQELTWSWRQYHEDLYEDDKPPAKQWSWRQYQDDGEDDEPPAFASRQISPRLQPVYRDPYSCTYPTPPRNLRANPKHTMPCNLKLLHLSPSSRNW